MKINTVFLFLYFFICLLTIYFSFMGENMLQIYSKAIVVPSIFIYYLITNNYKINFEKVMIFLVSFIGEIYFIVDNSLTEITPIICFMIVYLVLIKLIIRDFNKLKFINEKILQIIILVFLVCVFALTILNLEFDNLKINFLYFTIYGIVLGILTVLSFANFILKPCYTFFNLVLMSICFVFSDVLYLIDNYYLQNCVLKVLAISTQVFSYFFMIEYFIQDEKHFKNTKQ